MKSYLITAGVALAAYALVHAMQKQMGIAIPVLGKHLPGGAA